MRQLMQSISELLTNFRDLGLLIFRLGLGGMFMWHGWPKVIGGTASWAGLGNAMGVFGITFMPVFWGFMAAFAEFGGGLLFALGLFYRFAAFLLFFNMAVAFVSQMVGGKGLQKASQSLEDGLSFFASIFVGPGKYSLDYLMRFEQQEKKRWP